ncbi:MAG: hypothetical protein WAV18_32220 [Roseiarcus sp.]
MVAWETYIDATRDYSNGLYGRISVPQRSVDGNPAPYGYASRTEGVAMTGRRRYAWVAALSAPRPL